MRVAVDATALFGPRTGVGVFTSELLKHLPSADCDVSAYAVTWRGRGRLASMLPAGVHTAQRLPAAAQPLRQLWRRSDWPPIDWWCGPADVVHGPNFVVPPTHARASIVTIHDLGPWRYPEFTNRDTAQYPGLVRRALARGAHVHAPSRFVADETIELLGAAPERVHVVHEGAADTSGGDAAAGRRAAGGHPYVLALGAIDPRKDLPLLVGAFDDIAGLHADLHLVVAGPDGAGRPAFDAAVARAQHRDRIVRLGWVPDETRADLLAGARVFAYPSIYEGFGLPPLEAMRAGVPVVATAAGALPEICGDAARLSPGGDRDAFAESLTAVLGDDALRAGLVARGQRRVASFSWAACADGLRSVYRALTSAAS